MLAIDQTGRTLEPWQRRVVWTLVAALANPATVLPLSLYTREAAARDTDIYLSTTYAGSTAEPAIMLILDTSDSMIRPKDGVSTQGLRFACGVPVERHRVIRTS